MKFEIKQTKTCGDEETRKNHSNIRSSFDFDCVLIIAMPNAYCVMYHFNRIHFALKIDEGELKACKSNVQMRVCLVDELR